MLVVTAEIWPGGNESRSIEIGYIFASNEVLINGASAYNARVLQSFNEELAIKGVDRSVHALRRRSDGVWALVTEILSSAGFHAGHGIDPNVVLQLESVLTEGRGGHADA